MLRTVSPVFRGLNRPLTIWGVDRRLVFLALLMGAGTFNFFGSVVGGSAMASALFVVARLATAQDPEMPRIVLNASRLRSLYDPLKVNVPHLRRPS